MTDPHQIYVPLDEDPVESWRLVLAQHVGGDHYRILDQSGHHRETWAFLPGDLVRCELRDFGSGLTLTAVERVATISADSDLEGGNSEL